MHAGSKPIKAIGLLDGGTSLLPWLHPLLEGRRKARTARADANSTVDPTDMIILNEQIDPMADESDRNRLSFMLASAF